MRVLSVACLVALLIPARAVAQPDVLLIWDVDNTDTQALVAALEAEGMTVTLSDTDETGYTGMNPSPLGFDVVIHLNGSTYATEMPAAGQIELDAFVSLGGGFISGEWNAYQVGKGEMLDMTDLILFERTSGSSTTLTLSDVVGQETHPILANVPSSFSFYAAHNVGAVATFGYDEPVVLMQDGGGNDAVAVREWGQGRIVGFHHAGNNIAGVLSDANVQQLYIDGTYWAASYQTCVDVDGDGYYDEACGGTDCDDADPAVHPAATQLACDYVDNNCDGDLHDWEVDDDGDAVDECGPDGVLATGDEDCDDTDPAIHPSVTEAACDYIDNNCDGDLHDWEIDDDGDGWDECGPDGVLATGDEDCDDADPLIRPDRTELPCNGIDDDCDGLLHEQEEDADADGYALCEGDCNDVIAAINPGVAEVDCDYIDNDCNGIFHPDEVDDDLDGYDECQGDADDSDPEINPGETEDPCDYIDNNGDGVFHPLEVDDDGDGWDECGPDLLPGSGDEDCDDTAIGTYPGAPESCDGVDTDCDGTLDEDDAVDAPTWYEDADNDGYGDPASMDVACSAPPGYVGNGEDCDDGTAAVNPGLAENPCDHLDNDCDGQLDPMEQDDDLDGVDECLGDCDDANADAYPGADEYCDGVDTDCDGTLDEDDALDALTWHEDHDGDGYGDPLSSYEACAVPPGYVDNIDDCDDTDPSIRPSAIETHDAQDEDCDGYYDEGVMPLDALVITEVMASPLAVPDADGEWIEVYNNTALMMNLRGLYVYDLGSDGFTVDEDVWVLPGEPVVLAASADDQVNGGADVDFEWEAFALDSSDELYIDHLGVLLDLVSWTASWPGGIGASLALSPTAYDPLLNDSSDSWCLAMPTYGLGDRGTPGEINPTCCGDVDGDGYYDDTCGGADCDDGSAAVNPVAEEVCDGLDNDCDINTDELADSDGDGYTICADDCDDFDAAVYPWAEEVCDGLDNDCSLDTDELVDGDGDGFAVCDGDCDDSVDTTYPGATELCDEIDNDCDGALGADEVDDDGDGFAVCDDDCDDADPVTYPGAPELCDEIDNDCDLTIDEDVEDDVDQDGLNACQGDCDDTDANTYPGAEEICDGADNDCDEDIPGSEADQDADGWMICEYDCNDEDASLNHDDLDGDGQTTCEGDCDDTEYTVHPGALEVCDGMDNNCDGVTDDVDEDYDGAAPLECGVTDCDDNDWDIGPGQFENCEDDLDNDCDGDIDEEDGECQTAVSDDDITLEPDEGCLCDARGSRVSGGTAVTMLFGLLLLRRRVR